MSRRGLSGLFRVYARTAWWGLVSPRVSETEPLRVHQAVVLREGSVLLAVRSDIRGWELPGGNSDPGETGEETLRREVLEETGIEVEVERRVGDYTRAGFRPHTARVWLCRPVGGGLRPSAETRAEVARYVAQSTALRDSAEVQAARADHAAALRELRDSIGYLERALTTAGLVVPAH